MYCSRGCGCYYGRNATNTRYIVTGQNPIPANLIRRITGVDDIFYHEYRTPEAGLQRHLVSSIDYLDLVEYYNAVDRYQAAMEAEYNGEEFYSNNPHLRTAGFQTVSDAVDLGLATRARAQRAAER